MLIDQHSNGYSAHVKSMKKVLNAMLRLLINSMCFFQLQHTLCHGGDNVWMTIPDLHQDLSEVGANLLIFWVRFLKFQNLLEASLIPALDKDDGRHPYQVLWQQMNLLHHVRQSNRQLFPKKCKRCLVTCFSTWILTMVQCDYKQISIKFQLNFNWFSIDFQLTEIQELLEWKWRRIEGWICFNLSH